MVDFINLTIITKTTHSFDEWYKEVLQFVKEGHSIQLLGVPDPDNPIENCPISDEELTEWDNQNRHHFRVYYENGETPMWAMWEFVT